MPEEISTTNETKVTSDGTVKISVEKYEELLARAARKPPVVNQTTVIKTAEMVAKDYRMWGGSLMALGVSLFTSGALIFRAGLRK